MKRKVLDLINTGEPPNVIAYRANQALALFIYLKLAKDKYYHLHMQAYSKNANIYPSYCKILQAKKRCYPTSGFVTESSPEIDLLDHTAKRFTQFSNISGIINDDDPELILISKWGMDGASG